LLKFKFLMIVIILTLIYPQVIGLMGLKLLVIKIYSLILKLNWLMYTV